MSRTSSKRAPWRSKLYAKTYTMQAWDWKEDPRRYVRALCRPFGIRPRLTAGWEMQLVRFEPGARFPVHTHEQPEFLFVLEGELVQAGRRLGPGWASVASPGSVDADVYSEAGCVFVLVDRA